MTVPGWWQLTLLALAAFRVYRLIARDTITDPIRAAVTYPDSTAIALSDDPEDEGLAIIATGPEMGPSGWRVYLSTLVRCPWCAGFYVSGAWWVAWLFWPRVTLATAAPFAVSTVVALLAKNLDA